MLARQQVRWEGLIPSYSVVFATRSASLRHLDNIRRMSEACWRDGLESSSLTAKKSLSLTGRSVAFSMGLFLAILFLGIMNRRFESNSHFLAAVAKTASADMPLVLRPVLV